MADTHGLKTRVEPFVRKWLEGKYGQHFHKEDLPLAGTEGCHEFDAVSDDGTIVAAITSASGKTSGGKNPSGKVDSVYRELYFLSNVKAGTKLLVLTDRGFFDLICKKTEGKLAGGNALLHCPLSAELEGFVRRIRADASDEIDRGKPGRART